MSVLRYLLAAAFLATSCYSSPVQVSAPVPPSKDPFYTARSGFENTAPGTILRSRHAPGNLTSILGNCSAAYNLVYRTTDSQYKPSWAVTTLLVPSSASSKHTNILSYQIAYDSVDVDASPSFGLYNIYSQVADGMSPDSIPISQALGQGFYVSVPDYEGPLASFASGVQSGHAVIDSVRAVASAKDIVGCGPFQYALWGYSGGSFASTWAAELAVQYSPELTFSGAALGGTPANLTATFSAVDGSLFSGLIPIGLIGVTSQFPVARKALVDSLKTTGPMNSTGFFAVQNFTLFDTLALFGAQNTSGYFVDGHIPLDNPDIAKAINTNIYLGYNGVPRMPVFAYGAIPDKVALIEPMDTLYNHYCQGGADLHYQRNTVGGHFAESVNGAPRALSFLASVFEGTYNLTGCLIENVTVNITNTPDPL